MKFIHVHYIRPKKIRSISLKRVRKYIKHNLRVTYNKYISPFPKKRVKKIHAFCKKHIITVHLKQCTSALQAYVSLEKKQHLRNKKLKTNVLKNIHYSDTYECPECGERKVQYTQAQTRSADEGMTTFLFCVVCQYRWKEQ